jgi:hypothetical protein
MQNAATCSIVKMLQGCSFGMATQLSAPKSKINCHHKCHRAALDFASEDANLCRTCVQKYGLAVLSALDAGARFHSFGLGLAMVSSFFSPTLTFDPYDQPHLPGKMTASSGLSLLRTRTLALLPVSSSC